MKLARLFAGALSAVLLSGTVIAQAPQGEIDAHVVSQARRLFDDDRTCHTTSGIQPTKIMAITIHTAMKNGRAKARFVSAQTSGTTSGVKARRGDS